MSGICFKILEPRKKWQMAQMLETLDHHACWEWAYGTWFSHQGFHIFIIKKCTPRENIVSFSPSKKRELYFFLFVYWSVLKSQGCRLRPSRLHPQPGESALRRNPGWDVFSPPKQRTIQEMNRIELRPNMERVNLMRNSSEPLSCFCF